MIRIKGHSNFKLTVLKEFKNGRPLIRKSSISPPDSLRLISQCNKQSLFSENFSKEIGSPRVMYRGDVKGNFYFDMEYLPHSEFLNFLIEKPITEITRSINIILSFIDDCIRTSSLYVVNGDTFLKKSKNIKNNLQNNRWVSSKNYKKICSILDKSIEVCLKEPIPVGYCHGDLTMSNILFSNKKIIFIDFLDNFIESPLQDIVKLRQDTKHFWSLRLFDSPVDETKLKIVLSHIDSQIQDRFSCYNFYRNLYSPFQSISLIRVAQYAKSSNTVDYIINCLESP